MKSTHSEQMLRNSHITEGEHYLMGINTDSDQHLGTFDYTPESIHE